MADYLPVETVQKIICNICGVCADPKLEDLRECEVCPQFSGIPDDAFYSTEPGMWLQRKDDWGTYFECPKCHHSYYMAALSVKNFCPNCGKDLRGGALNG